jgi:hypothetical protein
MAASVPADQQDDPESKKAHSRTIRKAKTDVLISDSVHGLLS